MLVQGTLFTSRSEASTPVTVSLKTTWIVVKLVTLESRAGVTLKITGEFVFGGGVLTITVTTADVPRAPWVS
jgi:hypothetical protein